MTLLGPSGSGKTTTLMMLAGFEEPTTGRILIDGADVTHIPPYDRNLGMVFQNYALFPHMTVEENVEFPLRVRRLDNQSRSASVGKALALVKLDGFGGRRPVELSGGQQQRVALARALVFNPPILLMDEPMGALDKKLRQHMQLELKGIQQALGITVVYVTHDQEEAMSMSDRIVVMNNGRIEQVDSPQQIYHQPASRFVADFLGDTNFVTGADLNSLRLWRPRRAVFVRSRQPSFVAARVLSISTARAPPSTMARSPSNRSFFWATVPATECACPTATNCGHARRSGRYDFAIDVGHTLWVDWRPEHVFAIERNSPDHFDQIDQSRQHE